MAVSGFQTYQAALDWLFRTTDYERRRRLRYNVSTFDLSRMHRLLARLGNPHLGRRYVHIAGTKGKGSTAAMAAEVLRAAGLRVGLYTSPHVIDLRERIQVDGAFIAPDDLRDALAAVAPQAEAVAAEPGHIPPTFFEVLTAAAYLHFRQVGTDVDVLEVGMGGRLDATNVITPAACGITSLSIDHADQLGRTLHEIAGEKGGIIKPGVPVVSAPQPDEALAVIERLAGERAAPFTLVGREIEILDYEYDARGQHLGGRVTIRTPRQVHEEVWIALPGRHQAVNAAVAIGLLECLRDRGVAWDTPALRQGLSRAAPAARVDILARRPWVINDGAHNPASLRALAEVIGDAVPHDRLILVFASATDKDYRAGLAEIVPLADHVILTTACSPRSAAPEDLAKAVGDARPVPVEVHPDAAAAAERALSLAGPDDLVCFTGSFYLAGLIAAWWADRR